MTMVAQNGEGHLPYPYGNSDRDEEILAGILNALHHNSGIPQDQVRVAVQHGQVVLSGVLEQTFERDLAERIATTAPGVVAVKNEITVTS